MKIVVKCRGCRNVAKVWENKITCDGSPKRKISKKMGSGMAKIGVCGDTKEGFLGQENLLAARNTSFSKLVSERSEERISIKTHRFK